MFLTVSRRGFLRQCLFCFSPLHGTMPRFLTRPRTSARAMRIFATKTRASTPNTRRLSKISPPSRSSFCVLTSPFGKSLFGMRKMCTTGSGPQETPSSITLKMMPTKFYSGRACPSCSLRFYSAGFSIAGYARSTAAKWLSSRYFSMRSRPLSLRIRAL